MSIEALRWALDVGEERGLVPIQRHILMILGNRADEEGYLFPSITWVCRRTGYSRRAVQMNCAKMEKARLFTRSQRVNQAGDRISDAWQLAMSQPGLKLETPRASDAPPRASNDTPPVHQLRPPRAPDAPYTQEDTQEEKTTRGRGAPSPVSAAFQAYSEGIKRKYQADYPPSAKANGQLANVVGRVGRDNVVAVVNHYLAHQDPFYGRTKHSLDYLVRDCEKFALEAQAAGAAGAPRPPTHAKVALLGADGLVKRDLGEVPAGAMLDVARTTYRTHSMMAAKLGAKSVAVRQGLERRIFTIEELTT